MRIVTSIGALSRIEFRSNCFVSHHSAHRAISLGCVVDSKRSVLRMSTESNSDSHPSAKNVLGGPLELCSKSPLTGWYRDGFCNTDQNDSGQHCVCAMVTSEFLEFTKSRGNDLSTPNPYFPGLKPGDRWCLCSARWLEAAKAGRAPIPILEATHENALKVIPLELLLEHANVSA
mmetsp:Transcript_7534/g.13625  ORF Transcript_7534/g.13625 Transcript_7534/m.13625 type:complete len:175 (+) Transcript_7534:2307-2831(+)